MTGIALLLCVFLAAVGAVGVVSPTQLLGLVRRIQSPAGLWVATAFRIVLGVSLYAVAAPSRAPEVLRVLGVLTIAAGVATPFFGLERFRKLLDWWSARGPGFVRAWAAVALAFGLSLAYAVAG